MRLLYVRSENDRGVRSLCVYCMFALRIIEVYVHYAFTGFRIRNHTQTDISNLATFFMELGDEAAKQKQSAEEIVAQFEDDDGNAQSLELMVCDVVHSDEQASRYRWGPYPLCVYGCVCVYGCMCVCGCFLSLSLFAYVWACDKLSQMHWCCVHISAADCSRQDLSVKDSPLIPSH